MAFGSGNEDEPIDAVEDFDVDDHEIDPMQRSDSWSDHLVRKGRTVGPRGKGNPVLTMAAKGVDSSQHAYGTPHKPKPAKELSTASDFANKYRHVGSGTMGSSSSTDLRGLNSESPATAEVTHSAMKALKDFAEKFRRTEMIVTEVGEIADGTLTGTENAEEISSSVESEEGAEGVRAHEDPTDVLKNGPATEAEELWESMELHSVSTRNTDTSAVVESDAVKDDLQHWTEVLEGIKKRDEIIESRMIRCDQDMSEVCIEQSLSVDEDVVASVSPEPQQAIKGRWRKRRPTKAKGIKRDMTKEEMMQRLTSIDRAHTADEPVEVAEIKNEFEAGAQDPFFDWNVLDEGPNCECVGSAHTDVTTKIMDGIKIVSSSYEKVRKFLEREFAEAIEAGEDVEIYVRRLVREFTGDFAVIDALDDDPKNKVGLIDEGRYYRIKNGVTMDSGCSVFVMPSGWMEMFQLEESDGSRRGQTFQAAAKNSSPIKNEGQRTIKFLTKDMEKRKMTCQVAAVNKILASVGQICDGGNEVLFRYDGGEIKHLKSGKITPFRRIGNVYAMDAWIPKAAGDDPEERTGMDVDGLRDTGFTRPEAR